MNGDDIAEDNDNDDDNDNDNDNDDDDIRSLQISTV